MSPRAWGIAASLLAAQSLLILLGVDMIVGTHTPVQTDRWEVARYGWANWQVCLAGELESDGHRLMTRRAAVRYARRRWPVGG